jgi:hypothetical protein
MKNGWLNLKLLLNGICDAETTEIFHFEQFLYDSHLSAVISYRVFLDRTHSTRKLSTLVQQPVLSSVQEPNFLQPNLKIDIFNSEKTFLTSSNFHGHKSNQAALAFFPKFFINDSNSKILIRISYYFSSSILTAKFWVL